MAVRGIANVMSASIRYARSVRMASLAFDCETAFRAHTARVAGQVVTAPSARAWWKNKRELLRSIQQESENWDTDQKHS